MKSILSTLFISLLVFSSCKKESFINDASARLSTSEETLKFDTVFTSTGSVTQFFRIYNDNDQKLRLSRVALAGGGSSSFKINVDGFAGPEVTDIEMEAKDSLYVFVTVKINPSAADLPFIIQDSVRIEFNGNTRWVKLEAWGQNAHFMRSRLIASDEIWTNDKPYVILDGLQVDTNVTLTIQEGARIYLHADAPFVVDGTLIINGKYHDSTRVHFRGDRLDEPYRDYPASWPGIFFRGSSRNNQLNYTTVHNAYQGIVAEGPSGNANPKLRLNECIIDNCYDAGILGLKTSITAQNTLISNCGKNIILAWGGVYDFNHCTSVAYSNSFILHKEPALLVTDYYKTGSTVATADLNAQFRNSIFWGDNGTVDDEVITGKQGSGVFNVGFQHCLWKVKKDPANTTSSNMLVNTEPLFDSINNSKRFYDFHLKENSPVINKGLVSGLARDLDGKPRPVGLPDLGCYERQ